MFWKRQSALVSLCIPISNQILATNQHSTPNNEEKSPRQKLAKRKELGMAFFDKREKGSANRTLKIENRLVIHRKARRDSFMARTAKLFRLQPTMLVF